MVAATANDIARETANRLGRDPAQHFQRRIPAAQPHAPAPVRQPTIPGSAASFILKFTLILSALTALFAGLAFLIGGELSRGGHSVDTSLREIVIGNDVVRVPANMIRFGSQRRSSSSARLDLYIHWPSLSGYSEKLQDIFNEERINPSILFLSLEPRTMSRDMSGRIEPIYSKFYRGLEQDAGHGLKRRELAAEGGFLDEELVYESGNPYPFAARCIRESAKSASPYCIRDIHVGRDLTLTYRFHASLLKDWMRFDAAVRSLAKWMIVD
ncbi:MAG: hypothetical protein WBO55_05730 [Rhizobiaceae bacterium]